VIDERNPQTYSSRAQSTAAGVHHGATIAAASRLSRRGALRLVAAGGSLAALWLAGCTDKKTNRGNAPATRVPPSPAPGSQRYSTPTAAAPVALISGTIVGVDGQRLTLTPEDGSTVSTLVLQQETRLAYQGRATGNGGAATPPGSALFPGAHLALASGVIDGSGALTARTVEISPISGAGTVMGQPDGASGRWTLRPEGMSTVTELHIPQINEVAASRPASGTPVSGAAADPAAVEISYEGGRPAGTASLITGARVGFDGFLIAPGVATVTRLTILSTNSSGIVTARNGDRLTLLPDGKRTFGQVRVTDQTTITRDSDAIASIDQLGVGARLTVRSALPDGDGLLLATELVLGAADAQGIVQSIDGSRVTIAPDNGRAVTTLLLGSGTAIAADDGAPFKTLAAGEIVFATGLLADPTTLTADSIWILTPSGRLLVRGRDGEAVQVTPDFSSGPSRVVVPATAVRRQDGAMGGLDLLQPGVWLSVPVDGPATPGGTAVPRSTVTVAPAMTIGVVLERRGDRLTLQTEGGWATNAVRLGPGTVVRLDRRTAGNGFVAGAAGALTAGVHLIAEGYLTDGPLLDALTVTVGGLDATGTITRRNGNVLTIQPEGDRTINTIRLRPENAANTATAQGARPYSLESGEPGSPELAAPGARIYVTGYPDGDGALVAEQVTFYGQELLGTIQAAPSGAAAGTYGFRAEAGRTTAAFTAGRGTSIKQPGPDAQDAPPSALLAGARAAVFGYATMSGAVMSTRVVLLGANVRGRVSQVDAESVTINPGPDRTITRIVLATGGRVLRSDGRPGTFQDLTIGLPCMADGYLSAPQTLAAQRVQMA